MLDDLATASWFVLLSGASSVASLVISIYVFYRLSEIGGQIVFRRRRRAWLEKLRDARRKLFTILNEGEPLTSTQDKSLRALFSEVIATLEALGSAMPLGSANRRRVFKLRNCAARYLGRSSFGWNRERKSSQVLAWEAYEQFMTLCETLDESGKQASIFKGE